MKHATPVILSVMLLTAFACQKESVPSDTPAPVPPVSPVQPEKEPQIDYSKASLGDLARQQGILLGVAFNAQKYQQDPQVKDILTREFKSVTFENEMKHNAIVQKDGRMDFSTADRMMQWADAAGAEVFGHVLGWHSQQQTDYLNSLLADLPAQETGTMNPAAIDGGIDFESCTAGPATSLLTSGELAQINGAAYVSISDEKAHSGSLSLKMDHADGHADNAWDIQVVTKPFPVQAGTSYRIAWYSCASSPAHFQMDIRGDGDVQYRSSAWGQFNRTETTWTYQYIDYTAGQAQELSLAFYGATEAVCYYLDDIQIFPLSENPEEKPVREAIVQAFRHYVFEMVTHFDTYAWDVVNETFTEDGGFRTQENTPNGFVWGDYFGNTRNWVDSAFSYAAQAAAKAGKKPLLYINDFNLETSPAKRQALCTYARNNPLVSGVATQMHLDMATPDLESKIKSSLEDLAATGKMVRIAELDIKCTDENAQAQLFKYIFQTYLETVPEAQRGGITFWGINDKDSWVGERNAPLLWRGSQYLKKKGYEVLYLYLCECNGINPYYED